jgi:Hypothetical protein (DUF2513).
MKLNHDCIRSVLLYLESESKVEVGDNGRIRWSEVPIQEFYKALPEYSKEDIYYSLFNIDEAGYINSSCNHAGGSVTMYCVNRITFQGHEFLETIRDDKRWNKVKSILSSVKDYSLSAISAIAEGITTAAIHSHFEN